MDEKTQTKAKAGAMIVPVTLFEQNCTIIWCEATKKAVVIDPGGDVPKILEAIKQTGVTVEKIWLTHGHIDHVGGAAELRDALQVKIEGPHIADKYLLDNVVSSGERFGMTDVRKFGPDRWLDEGDRLSESGRTSAAGPTAQQKERRLAELLGTLRAKADRHRVVFVFCAVAMSAIAVAAMRALSHAVLTADPTVAAAPLPLRALAPPQSIAPAPAQMAPAQVASY